MTEENDSKYKRGNRQQTKQQGDGRTPGHHRNVKSYAPRAHLEITRVLVFEWFAARGVLSARAVQNWGRWSGGGIADERCEAKLREHAGPN